jgi:hypothetical protein
MALPSLSFRYVFRTARGWDYLEIKLARSEFQVAPLMRASQRPPIVKVGGAR